MVAAYTWNQVTSETIQETVDLFGLFLQVEEFSLNLSLLFSTTLFIRLHIISFNLIC